MREASRSISYFHRRPRATADVVHVEDAAIVDISGTVRVAPGFSPIFPR